MLMVAHVTLFLQQQSGVKTDHSRAVTVEAPKLKAEQTGKAHMMHWPSLLQLFEPILCSTIPNMYPSLKSSVVASVDVGVDPNKGSYHNKHAGSSNQYPWRFI